MKARPPRLLLVLVLIIQTTYSLAAAGRPLAPRPLVPAHDFTSNPVTAYAGGRFLTVWHTSMNFTGSALMGAFSDANGRRISERAFRIGIPPVTDPFAYRLVGRGDGFTLFWRDENGLVHMADVDLEGRVTNRTTIAGLPTHYYASFAWNGTHFLGVLHVHTTNVAWMVMLDRDGRLVVPPTALPGRTYGFDIAPTSDGFIAVTSGSDSIIARKVTAAGFGPQILIDNAQGLAGYPLGKVVATPAGSGDVAVVWGTSAGRVAKLESAIVRADGTRSAESLLASGTPEIAPLEILDTGSGYVAVFLSGSAIAGGALYRVRLDAAGAPEGEPELVHGNVTDPLYSAATSPGTILVPFNSRDNVAEIGTVAIPASGTPAVEVLSINYARQSQPVLGAGNGDVFAAWTELAGQTPGVRGTAVDANGEPREAVDITTRSSLASNRTAWNGTHHLIVHHDTTRLKATRVAADGTVVDATPIVLADLPEQTTPEAAVVWAGTRWIVVWSDRFRLHSITVSRSGDVPASHTLDVHVPIENPEWPRHVSLPTLAYDGRRVLLAWSELIDDCMILCVGQESRAYATRLTRTGEAFDGVPLDLDLINAPSLSAASSGREFLVVGGTEARVVDESAGTLRVTAARSLFDWPARSDVTWDGTNYVVALRYHAASWYLGVLRLDRAANDAAVRRATITLPSGVEAAPSIAAPFAGNSLIGVEEGTLEDGVAATVYRERDLAPLPAPPGIPRAMRVRQLTRAEYEVEWDPPAEEDADSYLVEQWLGGHWAVIARLPAEVRRARFTTYAGYIPPLVRVRAFNAAGPSAPSSEQPAPPKRRSVRR